MSGLFPEDFIEQVRGANDIVEVIGTYVQLKRAGASFKGLSPFTKEKTPSFYVNPDKQVFYCFSSGQGGDVFRFVMVYEGLKFSEAVERLAERAKLPIPRMERSGRGGEAGAKAHLFEIQDKVREWYHSLLMRGPGAAVARDYLKGRGLGAETAKRFRLGYSPAGWDGLIQWARREKIGMDALEKLGLVVPGKSGHYDRFRDRLMIPIQNEQGKTVGFTARLLSAGAKEAKYVNSPETEIFSKGKLLFGLDRAKRALMDKRVAIVCEGQIDCITCQEHGIENIIAPQGTALTEYQARILKRYADEVVFCFDADPAGRSATRRNALTLLREGLPVKAAALPRGSDPDSYVRERGADAFNKLVSGAADIFEWEVREFQGDPEWNKPIAKSRLVRDLGELWRAIPDAVLKESVLNRLSQLLELSEGSLERELAKPGAGELPSARPRGPTAKRGTTIEETLLAYSLLSENTAGYIMGHVEHEWLEEGFVKDWLLEIFRKMESEGWEAAHTIGDTPQADEKHRLRARLFNMTLPQGSDALPHLKRCIHSLQERFLAGKIRAKNDEFLRTEDPASKQRIQREIHDLEQKEHEIRSKKQGNG